MGIELLEFLKISAVQIVLLAVPMIFVLDSPAMHRVMSDGFTRVAVRALPFVLGLAIIVSFVHPMGIGMGVAILIPYMQWGGLRWLYLRFCRRKNRPPKVAAERADAEDYDSSEVGFRMGSNAVVVALPLAIVVVFIWLATEVFES